MSKSMIVSRSTRAFVAAALAAGLMLPTTAAFAKTPGANDVGDASFTLTGVESGDFVTAYQIFDTDIDGSNNLTFTQKVPDLPEPYDTLDKIQKVAPADARPVADAIAAKVIAGNGPKTAMPVSGDKVTLTLDSGYYLVVVTSNNGNTKVYQTLLVDATPDIDKNGAYIVRALEDTAVKVQPVSKPDKQILDPDGKPVTGTGNTTTDIYSVGDIAKFRITGTVPSYPADATHALYKITDKPDAGLSVDMNSFVVKQGDTTLSNQGETAQYKVIDNGDHTYTVEFAQKFILENPGASVTIDYSAKVDSINLTTGQVGNKAQATFNPNPYEDKKCDTDEVDPIDQTYGFSFKKLGASGSDAPAQALKGAEFTVTDASGNAVTYIDAKGNLHAGGKVVSDDAGWVYVNGLKAGTYTVTETKAPSGYQKVEPFEVVLSKDTAKGDTDATASITETNFANAEEKTDPKVGQLPTTGGSGTIMLTAGGVLLIVGGSAIALRSVKRNRKQN